MGSRTVYSADYVGKPTSNTTLVIEGAHGERKVAGQKWDGQRAKADVYVNWNEQFYTRTSVGAANKSPVFARHDISQTFYYTPVLGMGTTLQFGLRNAEYFGGQSVNSYSLGASQYFGSFIASYRFTHYDPDNKASASNNGHLVSLRMNDATGHGRTQVWLSRAKTLHSYDWLPGQSSDGKNTGITIERIQPITDDIAIKALVGRDRIQTPVNNYNATKGRIGLDYRW